VRTLIRNRLNRSGAPVFVQSFEAGNLQALRRQLNVPLVQLLDSAYMLRRENAFLPLELRSSADPTGIGGLTSTLRLFFALGVDGVFTGDADIAGAARG
jgi:glycerophosphoryl diester phosphodiesterase